MTSRNRILFYLFLALGCYILASVATASVAVGTFLVLGGIAELMFWFNLYQNHQAKKQADKNS